MTAIANLAKLLCKQGHIVTVYTTDVLDPHRPYSRYSLPSIENLEGVTVKRYHPIFRIFGYWVTPTIFKDLMTEEFDIINAHCVRSFQFDIAALISRIRNRKLIVNPHGSLYSYGEISDRVRRLLFAAHNAILKLVFRRASSIVATSSEEMYQFNRFGLDRRKTVLVPNFLDETQFAKLPSGGALRNKLGIGPHEKVLLFLGRLSPIKGLDLLLPAYCRIATKLNGVWLVMAGPDGGSLPMIQRFLKENELSAHAVLTGPLYGSSKIQALVDSDLVVVPSYYESFGITVIEAYFCRKPVVASNVGGLRDLVINGKNGFLFSRGKIDELVNVLEEALGKSKDLEQMGEYGQKFANDYYSFRAVENSILSLYVPY